MQGDVIKYFFGAFAVLGGVAAVCYVFANPLRKEVVERDMPFNNLYVEYGGDPNVVPDETAWRIKMGDRQAIYKQRYGDSK
eukprot:gene18023-21514_t